MNNEIKKNITSEEELRDATGGALMDVTMLDEVCHYCGRLFRRCSARVLSGHLYCPRCWENRENLNFTDAYATENGASGGW